MKVIDEVLHVLRTITSPSQSSSNNSAGRAPGKSLDKSALCWSDQILRTHEVLQELRDISSMAIDHFEEKIAPTLKKAFGELPTRSFLNCVPASVPYQRKYIYVFPKSESETMTMNCNFYFCLNIIFSHPISFTRNFQFIILGATTKLISIINTTKIVYGTFTSWSISKQLYPYGTEIQSGNEKGLKHFTDCE